MQPIKRALISVSDKTGMVEFARGLVEMNVEIISTGGTSQLLRQENIPVRDVADLTQFPEMMDGRLKTLHPKVHGGILGLRDKHESTAKAHDIHWIDLVIVNLYPFAETIKKTNVTLQEAIENIDIGGPTMIRSAAKNNEWVGVVVDPNDYSLILDEIKQHQLLSKETRVRLAVKAFKHTAEYDEIIYRYLSSDQSLTLTLQPFGSLRYGENPHQEARAYQFSDKKSGIFAAKQYQGKALSFNNIADADAAFACVNEFTQPACVIVKHANPCGVAVGRDINEAFEKAFQADSVSAFGGIVALNQPCTKQIAEFLSTVFVEVIIAPGFSSEVLSMFSNKTNLRILELSNTNVTKQEYKFVEGGVLIQDKNSHVLSQTDLKVVTQKQPTPEEIQTMLFSWQVVKHIKSNAILIAKQNATVGVGAGQVSRIDAVELAIKKAGLHLKDTVLASDAFFPFRDSIDRIAAAGIRSVIQPGGSVKDQEVIEACNEHRVAMVFTGLRCFKH